MVAEGLARGLGLGRPQHWTGRRHGVAVLEVLSQDALGAPERPLAITESRPLFTLRNGGSERWVSSAVSALVMERQSWLGPGFLVRCCFYYGSRSQAGSNLLVLRSLALTLSLPLCPLRAEITCRVIQICPWPLAVEASPHSWQWSSLHCLGL